MLSFLHQFLLFWKGNEVEVVLADKQPFMVTTGSVEARYYDQEFSLIKFIGSRKDGVLRKAYKYSKVLGIFRKRMGRISNTVD